MFCAVGDGGSTAHVSCCALRAAGARAAHRPLGRVHADLRPDGASLAVDAESEASASSCGDRRASGRDVLALAQDVHHVHHGLHVRLRPAQRLGGRRASARGPQLTWELRGTRVLLNRACSTPRSGRACSPASSALRGAVTAAKRGAAYPLQLKACCAGSSDDAPSALATSAQSATSRSTAPSMVLTSTEPERRLLWRVTARAQLTSRTCSGTLSTRAPT